jgi:hypothetical protein
MNSISTQSAGGANALPKVRSLRARPRRTTLRRILLLSLLTVIGVGAARAQGTAASQGDAEIEREILKVEDERDRAMQEGDADALGRVFADGYFYVNTRGQLHTKGERLADYRSGALKYLTFKQDNYQFHIYGDTVIMTGRASGVVKLNRRINPHPRQFTNVYIRMGGRWRLVFHQATPIVEKE